MRLGVTAAHYGRALLTTVGTCFSAQLRPLALSGNGECFRHELLSGHPTFPVPCGSGCRIHYVEYVEGKWFLASRATGDRKHRCFLFDAAHQENMESLLLPSLARKLWQSRPKHLQVPRKVCRFTTACKMALFLRHFPSEPFCNSSPIFYTGLTTVCFNTSPRSRRLCCDTPPFTPGFPATSWLTTRPPLPSSMMSFSSLRTPSLDTSRINAAKFEQRSRQKSPTSRRLSKSASGRCRHPSGECQPH